MTLARVVVGLGLLTLGCVPARASEPSHSPAPAALPLQAVPPGPPANGLTAAPTPHPAGRLVDKTLSLPSAAGPVPWTHSRAQNDAETFQFAIVTDRTGGMRHGVFDSAVRKLNLLEPEFVISVGDLIAGYSENVQQLHRQWDEFDALVRGLSAPFFYVPGNHDLSNDAMREVWRQRYGSTYYSFVYKDVLFVCLNSMDGGLHQISEAQVAWLRAELAKHGQVRWTLVFLHTPLWDDPPGSAAEASPWAPLEAAFGQRRYTVFAGHHHRYVKRELNSRKYFTLATTGGGSALRGLAYGEFDHIVWVTMTRDGPKLANLMLDGIQGESVRTDALRDFQNSVLADDTLKPTPIYYEGDFRGGKSQLVVRNDRDAPLTVTLAPDEDSGVSLKPARFEVVLSPNSRGDYEFELTSLLVAPRPVMKLPLAWSARAVAAQGDEFELSGTTALSLVRLLSIPRTPGRVVADGSLREWGRHRMTAGAPTQVVRNPENHHGASDAGFAIGLSHSKTMLSVAVKVHDDHVHAEKERLPWDQDGIELRIDARPDPVRAHSQGRFDGQRFLTIAMSPSASADDDWYAPRHLERPEGVEAAVVKTPTGFVAEFNVPKELLERIAGGKLGLVRINVAVDDTDPDGHSQLWWWPDWRSDADIPGSGTFRLR